jgi:hypothetical protein
MKFFDANTCRWILAIAFAVVVSIIATQSFAHHSDKHNVAYIGEYTQIPAKAMICAQEVPARDLFDSAKTGAEGFAKQSVITLMSGNCVLGSAYIQVDQLLGWWVSGDDTLITLVKLRMRKDDSELSELYGVMLGIQITPKEEKCIDCKPA